MSSADADQKLKTIVVFENVTKSYSSLFSRNKFRVLSNVNLTIPAGTIFGLLGPSGCGKTTLLKCVVGRLSPDEGTVTVFGHTPGTSDSGIPGKRVGYMPQDVALTEELSVNETLRFFGRIQGMNTRYVSSRIDFVLKLLQMDTYQNKAINTLSGGQKRRVSFAVALLHESKLLILDEPTVGVDPLLRHNIWKHLYSLASNFGVTILVTTHYIEEARMAHNVGLMLNGKLLVQAEPEALIRKFDSTTLEEAFVNVCVKSEQEVDSPSGKDRVDNPLLKSETEELNEVKSGHVTIKRKSLKLCHGKFGLFSFCRMLALTVKTFVFSVRHPASILLQLVVTPLTFAIFALSIGKAPYGIQVAIVNRDVSELSHLYVESLNKHTLNLIPYDDYNEAIKATEEGIVYGALYINENFTDAVLNRFSHSVLADETSLYQSKVELKLDYTNQHVALAINHEILDTFRKFASTILNRMGFSSALADIPIKYHGGGGNLSGVAIDSFLMPGFMICIIFFMALGTTTISHLNDKQLGCVERLYVSGITDFELIIAQLFSQTIVLLVMVPLVFLVVFLCLGFECHGAPLLALILNILQGVCGISLGLLVASITNQLTTAIVICLAMFFVAIMTQGVMWPLESLPFVFRYVSFCLPSTYSVLAMRSIILHSCGITCFPVIMGYVSSFIYISLFTALSWVALKLRM